MAEAIVGYTTLRNKLHITLAGSDTNRPNCGQGRMIPAEFVWSEEHPTSAIIAISRAYEYTLKETHDYCKRCFPWHTEEAN
jgi:hypothetical protein